MYVSYNDEISKLMSPMDKFKIAPHLLGFLGEEFLSMFYVGRAHVCACVLVFILWATSKNWMNWFSHEVIHTSRHII